MGDNAQVKPMDDDDRLKLYSSYAEIDRKWTSVMDSKGTFFSAMNAGILAFLWGSVKIKDWDGAAFAFGAAATACSLLALIAAILVITPRESLSILVGRRSPWTAKYKPLSFYGYIAKKYGKGGLINMIKDFRELETEAFAYEALEQHHSLSQVVQRKSNWVFRSAALTFMSLSLVVAALLAWRWP
ncbi:Pycsar system effector family protein [Pseudoduganella sp. R-34]|uniref:Pycsar system effector family protein n=1 Tax=Pseudoduganella sp. R-34 TaxID=3404062 RepID=UPI003CFB6348